MTLYGGELLTSPSGRSNPREIIPLPNKWETGWAPEPVWKFWRREEPFTSAGVGIPNHPPCTPVAMPTKPSVTCYWLRGGLGVPIRRAVSAVGKAATLL